MRFLIHFNPDNLNRKTFELLETRVIEGKISKKMTWRGIEKCSSYRRLTVYEPIFTSKYLFRNVKSEFVVGFSLGIGRNLAKSDYKLATSLLV